MGASRTSLAVVTMKWALLLLAVPSVFFCQAALPLPPYIRPCARSDPNFNECALQHGKDAFPQLVKGDPKYHVPPLDPLEVKEMTLADGGSSAAALKLVLKNAKIYGLKDTEIKKTQYDFDKQHLSHEVTVPTLNITGQYKVSGRILLLPITGQGDISVTLVNCKIKFDEDYAFNYIDGVRHLDSQNAKSTIELSRIYVNLKNLFNGDPLLNKRMNEFMNENWEELFREIKPSLSSVLTEIIVTIFSGVDRLVPFDVIFPENLPE